MRSKLLLTPILVMLSGTALASEGGDRFPVVSDRELSTLRGGFTFEGLEVTFGAEVRTYLEGELVLQTNISWDRNGGVRSEFVSPVLSPADADQLHAGFANGSGINFALPGQKVYLANQGHTALFHRTDGALQNILLNTANYVNARQEVDATIDLPNASSFLDFVAGARLGDAFARAVSESGARFP